MNRILVPTNFSKNADKALDYALQIAKKVAGEIILLHVCSLPDPEFAEDSDVMKEHNRLTIIELNAALRRYKCAPGEPWVNIKTILAHGDTVDTIVNKAQQYKTDLIIMGTEGAGKLKAFVLGTHTAAVMAKSQIPVITVPRGYNGQPPTDIVLAIDQEEEKLLLAPVFRLRQLFASSLKTLTFSDKDAEAAELMDQSHTLRVSTNRWKADFALAKLESEHLLGDDFCDAINRYIDDYSVNLLVMVTHRKNFLQRLFRISTTRKMAYHTHIPLMSLHA